MKVMSPQMSILNPNRKYVSHADVQRTWKAYGWKPTTAAERKKKAKFKDISIADFFKG